MNKEVQVLPANEMVMQESNEILDLFMNMQAVNQNKIVDELLPARFPLKDVLRNTDMCFYRINKLSYDEEYPQREAFENVLMAMENTAFNFVYILTGNDTGIDLDIGVVANGSKNATILGKKLNAINYGEIVENNFNGNFPGSSVEKIKGSTLREEILFMKKITDEDGDSYEEFCCPYENAGVIMGVPSINDKDGSDKYDFQGIDRLINSMMGLNWRIVIVCEPVSKTEILGLREDIYELYNRLSVCAKRNVQKGVNSGDSISFSKNTSESRSKNQGWSESDTSSKGGSKGSENSSNWNKSSTTGKSGGSSISNTSGETKSYSQNRGTSASVTVEIANKRAQEMMKYIDEEMLERLKLGFSKGLFKTSVYYMAEKPTDANRLKVGIMSLFQGNKSSYSPLISRQIDLKQKGMSFILANCQNRYTEAGELSSDALMLLSKPFYGPEVCLGTYLTAKEVSLLAGLPQKEVPGLTLREAVGFGLNEKNTDPENDINLGWLVQKGRDLKKLPFYVSRKALKKHTFIAGTTGSGKTTTCHRLLMEAKEVPFLVLEPAKTEYRTLINSQEIDDLIVFTLGNETVAPFRINPFELIKGEIISAHVDMVKATFTSAFPMEASMPQLLEEAIYKCYVDKGWNIDTNENDLYGEKAYTQEVDAFPVLSDLLETMKQVVETKGFSQQMKSDYIGSLVSRLSNLTVGSKGAMLNCAHSIDFTYLAHHNVVLEMEELKSPEDKALVMGFILSRLAAVIKEEHHKNAQYTHLTLVEEAHRLLAKVDYGDSGSKKVAVESFTDMLAEVRKYGEGMIIVDQIPNKLASEVLKNTNTKIIHKILAKDDKEAVGDTMMMDDKQKTYLSALGVGDAVVFTENTDKPVNVHVYQVSNTEEAQIENDVVRTRFLEYKERFGKVYEDLEIIPYYNKFDELANNIGRMQIDEAKLNQFKAIVKNIALKYDESEADVWRKFIRRRDLLKGIQAVEAENYPARYEALSIFFSKTVYKKDFSKQDIYMELIMKKLPLDFK